MLQAIMVRFEKKSMFDFKEKFHLESCCPCNENNYHYELDWLEFSTEVDWAIVFLGVGGTYLDYPAVFEYALRLLDKNSDPSIEQLALMGFEEHPDYLIADSIIRNFMDQIEKRTWAIAFLRLFFSTLKWFCNYVDIAEKDYQLQLDYLCYDFDLMPIETPPNDDHVYFPYFSVGDVIDDMQLKETMRQGYERVADRFLNILDGPDLDSDEVEDLIKLAYEGWEWNSHRLGME